MAAYDSRSHPAGRARQEPISYPPANYEPGDYPSGYYAEQDAPGQQSSRYSPSGRQRSDSGVAAGPAPIPIPRKRSSPGYSPGGTLQGYGSAPAQFYFAQHHSQPPQQQHYWYQPPTERIDRPVYAPPMPDPLQQRNSLHPTDAYTPRPEAYPPQGRRRARSDVDTRQPPAPYSPYSDRYTDSEEEDARRDDARRRRRRRRSEGAYSDTESRRGRDQRRRKSRRKSSYDDKRPTLAESAIWAFSKAKQYVTSPY